MAKKQVTETKKTGLSFLDSFNKDCAGMDGIATSAPVPKFWIDTGSYVINKVISGSYTKGFPQGRLAMLAGPSGAGKSFLAGNAIKAALNLPEGQKIGVLVIDSENAIDDDFLINIGADVVDNPYYTYRGVTTISQCLNIVSKFTKQYREAGETIPFLIVIDSLDMLQTDSENEQYQQGEIKGDQGQHVKQLKAMLKRFVNDIRDLNIAMICTKQVYKEQDKIAAYTNPWVITEGIKFAFSQVLLITRLMMKDDKTKIFEGIELKVRGEKTRFAKPYQQARVAVPYDTGMDPYTGILEAAASIGVVEKNGGWYTFNGNKFQQGNFDKHRDAIFAEVLKRDTDVLSVEIEEEEDETGALSGKEIQHKRKTRDAGSTEQETEE